jgi:hypothetical protein
MIKLAWKKKKGAFLLFSDLEYFNQTAVRENHRELTL